jgi:two-component system phosphate regulon response regulator PhoB
MDELSDTTSNSQRLTVVGEFLLDRETIRVWRGNKPLKLSMRQFRLMDVFMRHSGKPLSRKALKELVWGPESSIDEATVNTEIAKLRRAIGGRRRDTPIQTVRKVGFVFEAPKRRASSNQKLVDIDNESRP